MNRSVSVQVSAGIGFFLGMTRLRRSARVPRIRTLRAMGIPVLLALAFGLCGVSAAWSQEHEVPKVEILGGYSYLRSSDTNFNGWKASLVGNVNSWLGIAADFDGHYTGRESEHSITFGPEFAVRKSKKWTPVGYALFGVAIEKAESGETEHGFATELGGGLDYEINHQWAVRVFDATASITHIGGETHVSPKFAFGVVFSLGHK
jgi:hypothetical protein